MNESPTPRILRLFSVLLDYPGPGLIQAADECLRLVDEKTAARLHEFREFAAGHEAGQLEEIYTGVFELNPVYYPYVGYHIFGETYKRSVFLLGLKERYAAHGFTCGTELADHLVVMLRFAANCQDPVCAQELLRDALAPALEKMIAQKADEDSAVEGTAAYRQLLCALQQVLQESIGTQNQRAAASLV